MHNLISSAKLLVLIYLLKKIVPVLCENSEDVVNENLFYSKNMIHDEGNPGLIRLLSENKFNLEILKNVGKESDVVNHYEDITILDSDGELKNLKYKSAKIPVKQRVIHSDEKNKKQNDKVMESDTQVESTLKGDNNDNFDSSRHKSKFFDELGCKYMFMYHFLKPSLIRGPIMKIHERVFIKVIEIDIVHQKNI